MSSSHRTVIVGASSGIGRALALELAKRGDSLVLIARRKDELDRVAEADRALGREVHVIAHDAGEIEGVPSAYEAAERFLKGPIDRIVYAAGIMPKVGLDEFSTAKDASMMQVNVVGAMAWLNRAAEDFSKRGAGQIVGISSVAGERGRVGAPGYNATKAALTSYLESLRNRLSRLGVSVVTVKPGFIGTDMLKGVEKTFGVMSAEACARVIANAMESRRQSFYVPFWWGLIAFAVRSVPSVLFRRLKV